MASDASNTDNEKTGKRTLGLVVIILLAFFAFYGIALVSGIFFSSPDDYSGVEKVASTLGPIAAGVIGYYFGQRPVQSLTEQVQKVAVKRQEAKEGLEQADEQTGVDNQQIRDLADQVRTRDKIIERLIKEIGEK
jgi:PDZ domain-containing secreted protein